MRAVILAAGEGTRLRPHTLDRPKCLVELCGRPLLLHQISALERAGIDDVTVVTGYRAEKIRALGLPTTHNARYARTNMVASLMCADHLLDGADDVLVLYSDLIYEPRIVAALLACPAPLCTTVDTAWRRLWEVRLVDPLCDAETLKLGRHGEIVELGKKPRSYDEIQGQFMGLIKLRADAVVQVVAHHRGLDPRGSFDGKDLDNIYMTSFLQDLIDNGCPVRAVPVSGGWLEVDTSTDLETYRRLETEGRLGEFCRIDGERGRH